MTTIVERAKSISDRERKERSKEIIAKIKQRRLRAITLQIKIKKSPILLLPF